jgi:hypothetical protein
MLSLLLVITSLSNNIALAQTAAVDFEIPTITSSLLEEDANGSIVLSVGAVDNVALSGVFVFYRFSENSTYRESVLTLSSNGLFTTVLGDAEASEIQYYVVAEDTSGNKTQRGNLYFPIVAALSNSGDAESSQSKPKYLYYILGALALGAVAGLAGGGGGSEGATTNCCTITINTTPE